LPKRNTIEIEIRAKNEAGKAFTDITGSLKRIGEFAIGATLAKGLDMIVTSLKNIASGAVEAAARVQMMTGVVEMLGERAGHSTSELEQTVESIKALGIRTDVAQNLVARFAQRNLNLADAVKLARVAQDAGTLSMVGGSEALDRIMQAVMNYNVRVLRTLYLTVQQKDAFGEMGEAAGEAASDLDNQGRSQAIINAILQEGAKISGVYAQAMDQPARQLASLSRIAYELQVAIGTPFLNAFGSAIKAIAAAGKEMLASAKPGGALYDILSRLGAMAGDAATKLSRLALEGVRKLGDTLTYVNEHWPAFLTAIQMIGAALAAGAIFKGITLIAGALSTLTTALGVSALAIAGPAGLLVALGGILLYVNNVAKAHQATAASALAASDSYAGYIEKLNDAGLANYVLTEKIYETIKAKKDQDQAFTSEEMDKAKQQIQDLINSFRAMPMEMDPALSSLDEILNTFRDSLPSMNSYQLALLQDVGGLTAMWEASKKTVDESMTLSNAIAKLATAEEKRRQITAAMATYEYRRMTAMMATATATEGTRRSTEVFTGSIKVLATTLGMSEAEVFRYKVLLGYTDEELKKVAEDSDITGGQFDALAESTGYSREQLEQWHNVLGGGEGVLKSYTDALKDIGDKMEGIASTWANSILKLRDLDAEAASSTADYKQALKDLGMEAGKQYDDIKKKYQNSLPDPTEISERVGMTADAWDEWALRMGALMDGVQTGQEQGWMDTLRAMTDGTALSLEAAGGNIQTWLTNLKMAFYNNQMPDLINKDAPEWKEHATNVSAAQASETASVQAGVAARRAALEKERQEELAAQQKARQDQMVQLALQLAQDSGALQQWAQTRLGAMSSIADTAPEVWALLQSGMLGLDSGLSSIIANYTGGLTGMLTTTESQAGTTSAALAAIMANAQTQAITAVAAVPQTLAEIAKEYGVSIEDAKAIADANKTTIDDFTTAVTSALGTAVPAWKSGMGDIQSATTTSMATAKSDMAKAMGGMALDVATKGTDITAKAKTVATNLVGAFANVKEDMGKVGKDVLDGIQQGIDDNWSTFEGWVIGKLNGLISAIMAEIGAGSPADATMPAGESLVTGIKAGWDHAWGGAARSMTADVAGLVGARAGAPSFTGAMRPALSASPSGVALAGDTYYVSIQDRLAAAMFLSAVKDRQTTRLNGGMR